MSYAAGPLRRRSDRRAARDCGSVGVALDNARLYEASIEEQKRLSAILHSTADGIIATDCSGRIQMINQAAAAMLEVQADAVLEMPLRSAPMPARLRDSLLFALSTQDESSRSFQVTTENGRALSVLVSEINVESQVDQNQERRGLGDRAARRDPPARSRTGADALHSGSGARHAQSAGRDAERARHARCGASPTKTTRPSPKSSALPSGSIERLQRLIDDLFNLEHIQSGYGFTLEASTLANWFTKSAPGSSR